jgi:hypothetical protein
VGTGESRRFYPEFSRIRKLRLMGARIPVTPRSTAVSAETDRCLNFGEAPPEDQAYSLKEPMFRSACTYFLPGGAGSRW